MTTAAQADRECGTRCSRVVRVAPASSSPAALAVPVATVDRASIQAPAVRERRAVNQAAVSQDAERPKTISTDAGRPYPEGCGLSACSGIIGSMSVRSIGVAAVGVAAVGVMAVVCPPGAWAKPSDPGVVSYAVLGKGSVGNVVGAPMGWEAGFTAPFQGYFVDTPVCNNWGDIGLTEVYADPDLASFNGATAQTTATDDTHLVKQSVGVFATNDAATRAFHRIVDRTAGCAGQTTALHLEDGRTEVWSFSGAPATPTDASWVKQEAGTDRRCFVQTRLRENVLLQAKVCQSGNGGPAVNVLAGAMQNALGQ